MKYPQNEKEKAEAIEFYRNYHAQKSRTPDMAVSIEKYNGPEGCSYVDIECFYNEYDDGRILIKSLLLDDERYRTDKYNPFNQIDFSIKDFIAATDAIKSYINAKRENGNE